MNYKKYTELNDDIIKIRTSVFIDEQGFKDEFDETNILPEIHLKQNFILLTNC